VRIGENQVAVVPVNEQKAVLPARAPASTGRTLLRRTSARYWVCLGLLLAAALGLRTAAQWFGLTFRKEAVPLKAPLEGFDVTRLGPRYVVNKVLTSQTERLSEDMEDSLGTEEYARLWFIDNERSPTDPDRLVNVFLTYYTGKPDMVPHVPDECFQAGGYDKLGAETHWIYVRGIGAPGDRVPIRVVRFQARRVGQAAGEESSALTVTYFFHVNNHFATTRNEVRMRLMNPFERYGYYAKIEISFTNIRAEHANLETSLAALGPFLERLLPVLYENHFGLDHFDQRHHAGVSG
jgi:hypothetical protein